MGEKKETSPEEKKSIDEKNKKIENGPTE